MSRISTLLSNILSAVYGRDVRQSIHDAISQCYTDVSLAKTLADSSVGTMTQKITDCDTAAEGARTAANTANASASNADASASSALTAASTANAWLRLAIRRYPNSRIKFVKCSPILD